ncbi:heat shock protein Hsp90 family protein [Sporobolomyces koalae]|uniref:heat shock protein Hsp90 family protein n=1 Tax=Sporobolomyces koalae TaxID=500713 RepID=UPI00317A6170
MRILPLLSTILLASGFASAAGTHDDELSAGQTSLESNSAPEAETHAYQSDIARLMKVVVSHLYHDKDVFVRELLSNANDAVEKARFLALTDPTILDPAPELNVTVTIDHESKRIMIRDTGIGMTKQQLATNLGTIARSGTAEFVNQVETAAAPIDDQQRQATRAAQIGQFGLGFYSSFLVASRVQVASKSPESIEQYVFESEADSEGFKLYRDPRGDDVLGRGTEITLWLKDDSYLDLDKVETLIKKHAQYNSAPIYLVQTDPDSSSEPVEPKLVNDQQPLWTRDPKQVSKEEYDAFFEKTFGSTAAPLGFSHFKGDVGSTAFRALVYIPSEVPQEFYSKDYVSLSSLKLFVRNVFITADLGKDFLPRHFDWIKVFVDVDDLPLNVGRDSLQKTRAISQIKKNLLKRIYDLFLKISEEDPDKFLQLYKSSAAGTALKIGAIEELDPKNKDKMIKLLRFESSHESSDESGSQMVGLEEVVERRKTGQNSIFYISGAGQTKADLEKSPFVESVLARGYEVLYFTEPVDEMLASSLKSFQNMKFVDCAKEGFKFGDEDEDDDEEKSLRVTFKPLVEYLKTELAQFVDKVDISTRLVSSPCLVTASTYGYTGNMERLIAAQNNGNDQSNFMLNFAKQQKKHFELNPRHPLVERLLEKVEDANDDPELAAELKETVQILWQTALLKSSYTIPDPSEYFSRIEQLLRKSLGVSETAQARVEIKPAPETAQGPPEALVEEESPRSAFNFDDAIKNSGRQDELGHEHEDNEGGQGGASWQDWQKIKEQVKTAGENVKKAFPDLSDDAGHEQVLHEEL